jgi:hypothetical protein
MLVAGRWSLGRPPSPFSVFVTTARPSLVAGRWSLDRPPARGLRAWGLEGLKIWGRGAACTFFVVVAVVVIGDPSSFDLS